MRESGVMTEWGGKTAVGRRRPVVTQGAERGLEVGYGEPCGGQR